MAIDPRPELRIAICGSASVGKTTLANALAVELGVCCIGEEMRHYIETTGQRLCSVNHGEAERVLLSLWRERKVEESAHASFVSDNCSLDFAAHALHYGCLTPENSDALLTGAAEWAQKYHFIVLLPWGQIPYVRDGVRSSNEYEQLRYQLLIEGLLRRYVSQWKLRFMPDIIKTLHERLAWVRSVIPGEGENSVPSRGIVYLAGAGPGNPGLLTVRAAELLRRADVVAHDALISPEILAQVPPTAELVYVGRRYGDQDCPEGLHPLVLQRAKAGLKVVRLKSGDPLIFGRGGEEAQALREQGIRFEIVPGISAALGAAAYAGIPLTDRRHASEVLIGTGHDASARHSQKTRRTTVLYMAGKRLRWNVEKLIADGYTYETPAALIAYATTPDQKVLAGTLGDIDSRLAELPPSAPLLLVVGDVVRLRHEVGWFGYRPMSGLNVLVARARPGVSSIAERFRELGARVWEAPTISPGPLTNYEKLDLTLSRIEEFDHVLFGCVTGVDAIADRLQTLCINGAISAIAIGGNVVSLLEKRGIPPVHIVAGSCRDGVERSRRFLSGKRLLLITSEQGRPHLEKTLAEVGAVVESLAAYGAQYCFNELARTKSDLDLIVLPSSSAARSLLMREEAVHLKNTRMIAIGPVTEAAALQGGATDVIRATSDDVDAIVSAAMEQVSAKSVLL